MSIVGDVLNLGATMYNAEQDRRAEERAREAKREAVQTAADKAGTTYDQMKQLLDSYNTKRIKLADDKLIDQYKSLIKSYEPQVYDFEEFGPTYTKTVDDFMNPEAEKIAELAGLKTQANLAGQGAAKGSGALANLGYSRWSAAEQLYKDAQDALKEDRKQAYAEYGDYIDRMQKKLDTLNQGNLNKATLLGGAVSNEQTAQSDYMSDLLSIMGDKASTNVNATIGAFS